MMGIESAPQAVKVLEEQAVIRDVSTRSGLVRMLRFGTGPAIVLIHGGHGSWLHWVKNIEALASGYSVWVMDMPGYGLSHDLTRKDLEGLAGETLEAIDAALGQEQWFALIGFSFGALVAAHVAARRAGVRKLALIGTAGHGTPRRPTGELRSWKGIGDPHELARCMRHNLAVQMFHDPAGIDDLALWLHTWSCMRTRFHSRPLSRSTALFGALKATDADVLLLWGEHDITCEPLKLAGLLTEGHPARRARIIPDAGHWVAFEKPDDTNTHLLQWLRQASADAPRSPACLT